MNTTEKTLSIIRKFCIPFELILLHMEQQQRHPFIYFPLTEKQCVMSVTMLNTLQNITYETIILTAIHSTLSQRKRTCYNCNNFTFISQCEHYIWNNETDSHSFNKCQHTSTHAKITYVTMIKTVNHNLLYIQECYICNNDTNNHSFHLTSDKRICYECNDVTFITQIVTQSSIHTYTSYLKY